MECSVNFASRAIEYGSAVNSRRSNAKVNVKWGHFASQFKGWSGIGIQSGSVKGLKIERRRERWEASACRRPLPPMEPQSAAGQLLNEILHKHSHLFHIAATQQLAKLADDRDNAIARQQLSESDPLSVLYRRIAELKAGECRVAAEEVMYLLIVKKFGELGIPMVPSLTSFADEGMVDSCPCKDTELESIHTPEVLDMIRNHLSMILGRRGVLNVQVDNRATTQIDRLCLARAYAASIMYGYFMRAAYKRFELETILESTTYPTLADMDFMQKQLSEGDKLTTIGGEGVGGIPVRADPRPTADVYPSFGKIAGRPRRLRTYLSSFDSETLQRCATLRSKESVNVIEKHAAALFERPQIYSDVEVPAEDAVNLRYCNLRRLVLEAVAFGSFLWDVEEYVYPQYPLTGN